MIASYQRSFEKLEAEKAAVLAMIESLDSRQLNASAPGEWSINEVIAHLITGERMSLQYAKKKILGVTGTGNTGPWEEFKMLLLTISQRLPGMRYKAPKAVVEQTKNEQDIDRLRKEWSDLRTEWVSFLEGIPEEYRRKKLYRHVVAGRLNLRHAILFMREHIIHHRPQIKRLLTALR